MNASQATTKRERNIQSEIRIFIAKMCKAKNVIKLFIAKCKGVLK